LNRIFTIGGSGTSDHRSGRRSSRRKSTTAGYVILDADQVVSNRASDSDATAVPQSRMGLFQATGIAALTLVLVAAVALGSMVGSSALLHLFSPAKQFDAFRALHEPAAVEVLLGLAVLWLLPPHPWAMSERGVGSRRHLSRSKAVA
jgi:hypothetical protein